MKIISETCLGDFKFWSGAEDTAQRIWEEKGEEGWEQLEAILEDLYPRRNRRNGVERLAMVRCRNRLRMVGNRRRKRRRRRRRRKRRRITAAFLLLSQPCYM